MGSWDLTQQREKDVREDILEGSVACVLMVLDLPVGFHSPFLPAEWPRAAAGILFWRSKPGKPPGPSQFVPGTSQTPSSLP